MRKILKWVGIIFGVLMGLAILAIAAIYYVTQTRLDKIYQIKVEAIAIPSDQNSRERGEHLVTTMGFCTECHGEKLAGQVWDDGWLVGRIAVPNLTSGKGGIGSSFSDEDWVRAIRYGIGIDKKSLKVMPSNYYYKLSDGDLAAIVAYLKQLPPSDNELPKTSIGPMARLSILLEPSILPAQVIEYDAPRPPEPVPGVTVEYGKYLANVCTVCHGENLAGMEGPGGGKNLTPGGDLAEWSEADFIRAVRTGVTPSGKNLDPEMMPWKSVGKFSDDELKAIWLYLRSLPAIETPEQGSKGASG
ncbi:MAG TPA: cytochrome c [Anaerolineales bacterium]|jgi:mono/diheme cytochrome c family protein|nr:cytochrome c [Anaerolineales bacterium]